MNEEGVEGEVKHVQFYGDEAYRASIPIEKAVGRLEDVLLVHTVNGEPLPRDHGYPIRALMPGHGAARSIKWSKRVVLSDAKSQSQWQQRDCKCFGPNQDGDNVDWSTAPAIQELPIQSAISSQKNIAAGSRDGVEEDLIELEGYAISGGGKEDRAHRHQC